MMTTKNLNDWEAVNEDGGWASDDEITGFKTPVLYTAQSNVIFEAVELLVATVVLCSIMFW